MTPSEMERRLLELSAAYLRTRELQLREEYRTLHVRWLAAKQ